MATPTQNKLKFNRKYIANNKGALIGPRTYIVDTSQTPPVNVSESNEGES